MLKRLLLVITTITVLFAFVTYQPKKVDAAAGTVVSFAAKQALKAATKSAVADTVGSLALKTVSKEVAENYVKKEGLNLVVLEGGKKAMVKTTMNQTEKIALKKEIDNVIDLKIYGNSPGWVKFLDWFIGVGAVVLVGQVLYAAVTGEMSAFISEIFNEAMTNLGWITPAVPLGDNGAVPGKDPVKIPNDSPVVEPDHPTNPVPMPDYTRYVTYKAGTSSSTTIPNITLKVPTSEYVDFSGFVWSAEVMHETVYPDTQFPIPIRVSVNDMSNVPPLAINDLRGSRRVVFNDYTYTKVMNRYMTIKLGDQYLMKDVYNTSRNFSYQLPSSFDATKYNKIISQNEFFDMESRTIVSRFILLNTSFNVPTLSIMVTSPFTGNTVMPSKNPVTKLTYSFYTSSSSLNINPLRIRLGIHTSMEMALDVPYLPTPQIGTGDIKVPMISPKTGKIAWPQKTILPDGYTYNPQTQEILDPVGNPVTNPETIPELNPDPVIETTPDGEQVIDGVPTGQPAPDPVSPPSGGGGSEVTGGDPKDINWDKLKAVPAIFTKKFPFSLPWDAKRFIDGVLGGVPQAKDIVVKLDEIGGVHIGMNITLPDFFDAFFSFTRTMTLIIFDIGLIFGLYRLLGGAS